MLKKVLYAIVIIAVIFVVASQFLPRYVHVERSIQIDRPAATVFTVLNSYHNFLAWSSWSARDPDARYEVSGPAAGVGARLSWSGDPRLVGSGWQEIVASEPYRRVAMHLDFDQQGAAESYFAIEEKGRGVNLTWGFDTDLLEGQSLLSGVLARYFGLFFDRWIGADYETGLARLKAFVESLPEADFAGLDVEVMNVEPQDILYVRIDDPADAPELEARLGAAYRAISSFMAANGIERAGKPLTITRVGGRAGMSLEAAVPVVQPEVEADGLVRLGHTPGGRAVRVAHRGPHATKGRTYDALAAWMAAHGLREGRVTWEQYVSDPAGTPPDELLTYIYALLADAG
jgi:effector-binding domain-containing protein